MQSFDLKEFRDLNNLSQLDTADYFGCTQGFISQIERKKRPLPDDYISKAFGDESKLIPEKHAPPIIKQSDQCENCRELESDIRGRDRMIDKMSTQLLEMREEINNLNKQLDHYRKRDTG